MTHYNHYFKRKLNKLKSLKDFKVSQSTSLTNNATHHLVSPFRDYLSQQIWIFTSVMAQQNSKVSLAKEMLILLSSIRLLMNTAMHSFWVCHVFTQPVVLMLRYSLPQETNFLCPLVDSCHPRNTLSWESLKLYMTDNSELSTGRICHQLYNFIDNTIKR